MTCFKQLALIAALTLARLGGAQAAPVGESSSEFVLMDPGAPGDFANSWTFGNAGFLASPADGGTETGTRDDGFSDQFLFNVPDDEYVSLDVQSELRNLPEVSFRVLMIRDSATGLLVESSGMLCTDVVASGPWLLTSGTYEIDLLGVYLKEGGRYDGRLAGSPVPEPVGWFPWLVGLGALGLPVRRRRKRP